MGAGDHDDELIRSVALHDTRSILLARQRAEEDLLSAREELRESRERLQAALDAAGTGTFRWNLATDSIEFDDNLDRLFGLPPGDTVSTLDGFLAAVHPDDRAEVAAACEHGARSAADFHVVFRVAWPDGSVHWLEDKGRAVRGPDGRPGTITGACVEITRRKEAEDAIRRNEAQLQALADSIPQLAWMAHPDGSVFWYNRPWFEYTGTTLEPMLGWGWGAVHDPEVLPKVLERWNRSLATGEPFEMEHPLRGGDGRFRWFLTRVNAVRDADGAVTRWFGTNTDVDQVERMRRTLAEVATENARLYAEAQRASEERKLLLESERAARTSAERMSEMKDEFLATLSHELRTPLSAILGWAHVLRATAATPADLAQGLEAIERNARIQTQLIEDLLDMSRVTSGKLRLDVRTVEAASFVEAALETVRHAAEAKAIGLEKRLDAEAGLVACDPGRMQQVTWNLLSNAIKFTPQGGRVRVTLTRTGPDVELAVSDTGAGIATRFLPHVFERFRQADASTTRRHGGLGLGLSIVKHLTELHGGSVRATSDGEGLGSTFTVLLPVAATASVPNASPLPGPRELRSSIDFTGLDVTGITVLVVDDQVDARDLMRRVLSECGARVLTAATATEALALVEAERPDVLVSDIGMPEMDGFELLRRIRALGREAGGDVPAIALTAFARSEDRTRALLAGFLVHVSKPVEPSELVATVASVARR